MNPPFLGLRTAIYHVSDLEKAKAWYAAVFAVEPNFDQPFYVGFTVGGFELGLMPAPETAHPKTHNVQVYWGVASAHDGVQHLLDHGAILHEPIQDVGEGVLVAAVLDPFGNLLGVIENPYFEIP